MIRSLEDLREHTRRVAADVPSLAKDVILESPGLCPEERRRLERAIPGLSRNYLACAERLALQGVVSGCFILSPGDVEETLVEGLIAAHSAQDPFFDRLRAEGLAEVASWEAEPVVVARKDAVLPEDTVAYFWYDEPEMDPMVLAPNFELFLLAAGNLYQLFRDAPHGEAAIAEFRARLRALGIGADLIENWKPIYDVMLIDHD